ncbi:MAG: arylsulfatase [Lentisphaeraceae bacterium]|nr:arylsulfatase [Lentisphaeraceae bacterium]
MKIIARLGLFLLILAHINIYAAERPNVIVIYTDDQGYGDVSALNPEAKFKTPNMDRLANEGIIFTHGHSADTVCRPSRYGLLTGRYAWRSSFSAKKKGYADSGCMITDDRLTLASLFKQSGYNTAMVGKWHLGMDFPGTPENRDWSKPILDMPLDKGFDYYYGIPASMNHGNLAWIEGRFIATPPTLFTNMKKNSRHSDYRIAPPYQKTSAEADQHLEEVGYGLGRKLTPSFHVAPDYIDNQCLSRFTNKAIQWMSSKKNDAKNGKPFFLYLPYPTPHHPVCPLPEFHGQGKAGAYGEFLIETDFRIGQILDFLEKSGLDKNTLIVFSSDNGPENTWPARIKDFDHDSRGTFRNGKRSVYEGGHRVPFLVRWPSGIKNPGRSWHKAVGQVDLLATFAELLKVKLADNAGEDSQSFASVLLDPNTKYDRLPLVMHGNNPMPRFAVTSGKWKLVMPYKKHSFELYDLSKDSAETKNIADQHPERVQFLTKELNKVIAKGRTTPGAIQENDRKWWSELNWMTKKQYELLAQ